MGELLAFKRPAAGFEELEELLRDFYAAEQELAACEWLERPDVDARWLRE